MKVLVCGSRTWDDEAPIHWMLDGLACTQGASALTVIEGGAKGADAIARRWAGAYGAKLETVPADWAKHGKAAGPIRNQHMLDMGKRKHKKDPLLATPSNPTGKGSVPEGTDG